MKSRSQRGVVEIEWIFCHVIASVALARSSISFSRWRPRSLTSVGEFSTSKHLRIPAYRQVPPAMLICELSHITYVMRQSRIIHDLSPLTEEFVPEELPHREKHRVEIEQTLEPLLKGYRPQPLLLHGPSGTGKTSLATDIAEELAAGSTNLKTCYVNCWIDYSRFRALYSVVQQIDSPLLIHRKGTPTDELIERFERVLRQSRCIVILDEVDQLRDKDTLYMLARQQVGLIFIADAPDALLDASMRTRSRLGTARRIAFKAYSVDELVSILHERARLSLQLDAVPEAQLRAIAQSAAGDARRAIETLRLAATKAEREGHKELAASDIQRAIPEARKLSDQRGISKLNSHQRVLYSIVQEFKEVSSADLYRHYYDQVAEPVRVRTLRNYLQKLSFAGFIRASGTGRWRVYSLAE